MQGLAPQIQEQLKRDPYAGDLYIFRGRRGDLAKVLWWRDLNQITSGKPGAVQRDLRPHLSFDEERGPLAGQPQKPHHGANLRVL